MSNPSLLLDPTVPPPLHGLSPRVILGAKWWDVVRKEAYAKHDDTCHACGVHKSKAFYKKYLEGHEKYDIDYEKCTIVLDEIVALCHLCHNYIHVGRLLSLYRSGVVSRNYVTTVLDNGITLLSKEGLKPQATQAIHWLMLQKGYSKSDAIFYAIKQDLPREKFDIETWDDWKIIINGVTYQGNTQSEWRNRYE